MRLRSKFFAISWMILSLLHLLRINQKQEKLLLLHNIQITSECICRDVNTSAAHVENFASFWLSGRLRQKQEAVKAADCCRCWVGELACVGVGCYFRAFWINAKSFLRMCEKWREKRQKQAAVTFSLIDLFMRGHTVTTSWWHRLWTTHVHTENTHRVTVVSAARMTNSRTKRPAGLHTLTLVTLFSEHTPATERKQSDLLQTVSARFWLGSGGSDSPDELLAVEAEGGLTEESGHELVPVDLVDPSLHGALPLPRKLLVGVFFFYGDICNETGGSFGIK